MLKSIFFWIKFFLVSSLIGLAILVYTLYYYAAKLPDYAELKNYNPPAVTRVYSSEGKLMEEYAWEHRIFVPINSIPKSIQEAFIAVEDKNFYHHSGVDVTSIIRASIANIKKLISKKKMEGGSTITQQVVKNFLLSSEQSLERKIKEAMLSYMISKIFTKEQILELYLNQVFLGKGSYGIAAASQNYFNKSIEDLTLAESAFLAGLPKAPSSFNPKRNYERAKERRDYVIVRMLEENYISVQAAQEAIDTPIELKSRDKTHTVTANYFANEVRNQIINMFGKDTFYTGGLTVITSLNSSYQAQAEKVFREHIKKYDKGKNYCGPITNIDLSDWQKNLKNLGSLEGLVEDRLAVILSSDKNEYILGFTDGTKANLSSEGSNFAKARAIKSNFKPGNVIVVQKNDNNKWILSQIPGINGAMLVMNPQTGQVLAMVGGYDYSHSQFNRATQAQRQPGSAIKPFIYLAAMESGIQPNDVFVDSPVDVYQGPGLPIWRPKNYAGNHAGPMTVRRALEKSNNIIVVKVAQKIGLGKVAEIIQRVGINYNPKQRYSLTLGALETTLDKLTSGYCLFANGGKAVTPQYIEIIKNRNGKIIYQRDKNICYGCKTDDLDAPLPTIVMADPKFLTDEASAYQVTSMLVGAVERGTAYAASRIGKIMGGKTGTSSNNMDTWFIGFTPKLAVGTYIGFDQPKSIGPKATGSSTALPIYIDFMSEILKNEPSLPFFVPSTIKLVNMGNIKEAIKYGVTPEFDDPAEETEAADYIWDNLEDED